MPHSRTSRSVAGLSKSTPYTSATSGSTSIPSTGEPRPRPRFPRAAVRELEKWLSAHRQSPYLTSSDLDNLTAKTRLKRSQISNWFSNVRKRGKVPKSETHPNILGAVEMPLIPSPAREDVPLFHRWLNSWTEHEAAALPAILEAVGQLNGVSSGNFLRGSTRFHRQFCSSESSLSSMEVRSYAANVESVLSDEWKAGDDISEKLGPSVRRHRRLPDKTGTCSCSEKLDESAASRKFQCTFCPDRFRTKYDWQRHEKSMHLPLEKWTCSPHGAVDVNPTTNQVTCVFCGVADPSPEHIGDHGYTICAGRPVSERTFYRKDHLRQHLRLMHGNCSFIASMDSWKSITSSIRSRCGFCATVLSTWTDRVDHLAEHFSDGYSVVENWIGDWGFGDDIMCLLERASLPGKGRDMVIPGALTAPTSMIDDSCTNSLGVESFPFDIESFTNYPCFEFEDFNPGNTWEGWLELPPDFFGFDSSHVKANDITTSDLPFCLPLDSGLDYELGSPSFPVEFPANHHLLEFDDTLLSGYLSDYR